MKKVLTILMIVTLVVCFMPTVAFGATSESSGAILSADCSKTATDLTSDYKSDVTLSFPSEETELVTDIVFVLDKSTSAELEQQALEMLKTLEKRVDDTSAKVKVGVVVFDTKAHSYGFYDLSTEYDSIKRATEAETSSGTNLHAGLLAGKEMLDGDESVPAERKYLIVVSDGITYMYNAEPTATAWTFYADAWKNWVGPDNWRTKYNDNINEDLYVPKNWEEWLADIEKIIDAQGTQYEYPYGGEALESTPQGNWKSYANSIDKALYLSNCVYQEAKAEGYHCFAMCAYTSSYDKYAWGPSFIYYLAGDKTVSFDEIERHVVYAVSDNSIVKDAIGKGIDNLNCEYNFDFVKDYDMLVKVGEKLYTCGEPVRDEDTGTLTYTFTRENDNANFRLVYYPEENERLEWYINQPITNFERVQLTFQVKLMNPSSIEGIHYVYTNDGHAILIPTDSSGIQGNTVEFPIPQVSYIVKKDDPPVPVYPSYTSVTVQKLWTLNDGGTVPESIQVQLMRNGQSYGNPVTLNEAGQWKYTWSGLLYGYNYTVTEVNIPDGFISSVQKVGNLVTIVNDDIKADSNDQVDTTQPDEPTKPDKPEEPEKPAKPEKPDTEVPKTGDASIDNFIINLFLFLLTLSALATALLWYRKYSRK